jgi:hypothetical protein
MRLSPLGTALQTLREHDQESWVLFVDLVKAYDTVNREMLEDPHNLSTRKLDRSAQKLYTMLRSSLKLVKLGQFLSMKRSSKATIPARPSLSRCHPQYPTLVQRLEAIDPFRCCELLRRQLVYYPKDPPSCTVQAFRVDKPPVARISG